MMISVLYNDKLWWLVFYIMISVLYNKSIVNRIVIWNDNKFISDKKWTRIVRSW